ncbi:hypothetical protein [Geodermatophilus sp. URMC 62]|uniref:hypothetical protein n=1 Tax=Geodermatophilus sp. URMC 62 TaxID=3423414 RepID=UPI00406CE421
MSDPAPCTRHARSVWLASCPACTAWHLAAQCARRGGHGPRPAPTAPVQNVPRAVGPAASLAA